MKKHIQIFNCQLLNNTKSWFNVKFLKSLFHSVTFTILIQTLPHFSIAQVKNNQNFESTVVDSFLLLQKIKLPNDSLKKVKPKKFFSHNLKKKIKEKNDSVFLDKKLSNTTFSRSLIKLSGTIRNNSYYSTNFLNGQEVPLAYNRTHLNLTLNVAGLPINSSFSYSTEDAELNRQIGMFQLNINESQISEFLKAKTQIQGSAFQFSNKIDSMNKILQENIQLSSAIREKLNNPNYCSEIEKQKEILSNASADTLYAKQKSVKIKLAKDRLNEFSAFNQKLDSLETIKKVLAQKIAYLQALDDLEVSRKLPDSLSKHGRIVNNFKEPKINRLLTKVKTIGIGDVYPEYSKLIMNGFMVRGIQTDLKFTNFFVGYTGGTTNNIGNQSPLTLFSKNSNIHSLNVGIKNSDESSFGLIILSGKTNTSDEIISMNLPEKVEVLGIKLNVNILQNGKFEFERAISNTFRVGPEIKRKELLNTFKSPLLNSSSLLRLSGIINRTKTNYDFSYQRNELYFYSPANPLIRPDFQRIDMRLEQGFYNNKFATIFGHRRENDNLSGTKIFTTQNIGYEYGIKLKTKRSRFYTSYKSTNISNTSTKDQILLVSSINTNYSRNDKVKKNPLITTVNYSYLFIKGQKDAFISDNHMGNASITYFIGNKFILRSMQNLTFSNSNDKGNYQFELANSLESKINKILSLDFQYSYECHKYDKYVNFEDSPNILGDWNIRDSWEAQNAIISLQNGKLHGVEEITSNPHARVNYITANHLPPNNTYKISFDLEQIAGDPNWQIGIVTANSSTSYEANFTFFSASAGHNEILVHPSQHIWRIRFLHLQTAQDIEFTIDNFRIQNLSLDTFTHQIADVISATDYSPFGAPLPGRTFSSSEYRFGFNGMEKVDEINGSGNAMDFGARIYDARLGRWLSRDPNEKKYPGFTPYLLNNGNPIFFLDPNGKDGIASITNATGEGAGTLSNPNSIEITATYYYNSKQISDSDIPKAINAAVEAWNKAESVILGADGQYYKVKFTITAKEGEKNDIGNHVKGDAQTQFSDGNFIGQDYLPSNDGDFGSCAGLEMSLNTKEMKEAIEKGFDKVTLYTEVLKHEIGHSLGLLHTKKGLMRESVKLISPKQIQGGKGGEPEKPVVPTNPIGSDLIKSIVDNIVPPSNDRPEGSYGKVTRVPKPN